MSIPVRPAPPKPSKPGMVKVVRSVYAYKAQLPEELSFDEDETLYILDMSDPGWWKAKCGTRVGLIPSNYVEDKMESLDNPLHECAKRGNLEFLKEILKNKVSVNGLDKAGSTPLHWAAHGGHSDCVIELLSHANCQYNVQNKLGDTPLHSAAWRGHLQNVTILLEKGARTDLRNKDNKTPLDLATNTAVAAKLHQAVRSAVNSAGYGSDEDSD